MEEYDSNIRPDIPGLVETDKNRKGKKKSGANKKTLSLQTFLQDEAQETNLDSAEPTETDPMESHFAKLNLDDEELIVMESCHSYFHDILRQMGPTNAMDARLQQEMDSFPPEAKKVIQKCGGYRNFILRSKDLAVVDKIVAAKADLKLAQEMAFKEIYNSLPQNNQRTKNEHVLNSEVPKDIWNSKPNILNHSKSAGNIWGNLQLETPKVDSLFNQEKVNSVYYKASSPDMETSRNHGVIGNGGSARSNLFKGLKVEDGIYSSQAMAEVPVLHKQVEDLKEINKKLVESNTEFQKTFSEKEKLSQDFSNLQSKYHNLESLYNNTKDELEQCKSELQKQKNDQVGSVSLTGGAMESDRQIILTLQKSLEAEKLRNLNLSAELELQRNMSLSQGAGANLTVKPEDRGFFSSAPGGAHGWDHSLSQLSLSTGLAPLALDSNMLGLRSIFSNDLPAASINPSSSSHSASNLFPLHGGGGGVGPTSSLGLTSMSLLESVPPPTLGEPPNNFPPLFSRPPPGIPPPVSGDSKSARQEQLIKKLSGMLPGTDEDLIKSCITELRAKHGKLSGWPTSKIATHIVDMMKENMAS